MSERILRALMQMFAIIAKVDGINNTGRLIVQSFLKQQLNLDTLMVGFGFDDDRIHSPNEKFELDALHNGTRTSAALYEELSKLQR